MKLPPPVPPKGPEPRMIAEGISPIVLIPMLIILSCALISMPIALYFKMFG